MKNVNVIMDITSNTNNFRLDSKSSIANIFFSSSLLKACDKFIILPNTNIGIWINLLLVISLLNYNLDSINLSLSYASIK